MVFKVCIADYSSEQFDQVKLLFSTYFDKDDRLLNYSYCNWLYLENFCGPAKIVRALEDDFLIGFMALIPVKFLSEDGYVNVYYAVNVLVHPNHQGKNVFGCMIESAIEFTNTEGSILMGHPNKLAIKQWQRYKMHFMDNLKPSLLIPRVFNSSFSSPRFVDHDSFSELLSRINDESRKSNHYNISLSIQYLEWRFLKHPTNSYHFTFHYHGGVLIGFTVTKKIKWFINLVVDTFVLSTYRDCYIAGLPFPSVAFSSDSHSIRYNYYRFKSDRIIPFFFTRANQSTPKQLTFNTFFTASDF